MRLIDYINQGGSIMYILLFLNIIGLATMGHKFYTFFIFKRRENQMVDHLQKILSPDRNIQAEALLELTKQEISAQMSKLEKGLSTIKIVATISPLLGLLGTVLGVLSAFQAMGQTGLNNPASFASGISLALITTVGGLIVAIPHTIGHSYLLRLLDQVEISLEHKMVSRLFSGK